MGKERLGELYIGAGAILWGLFPIISALSLKTILPPLITLAWAEAFGALFFVCALTIRGTWKELAMKRSVFRDIFAATAIIGILFYILTFFGLTYTTPGNVSLVALTEVLFAYLFFSLWHKEPISREHLLGAMCMIGGAVLVLYPNTFVVNPGDFLILLAAAIAPLGNFFSRRARIHVSSEVIMFIRSSVSAIVIFAIAYMLKEGPSIPVNGNQWILIAVNGFFLLGLSKIFWIEGIHRLHVVKANALSSINPLVTLTAAYVILGTVPTLWQIAAFVPMFVGILLLSKN